MGVYLPTIYGLLLGCETENGCSSIGEINQLTGIEDFHQINHYYHIFNKRALILHFTALHITENQWKGK
tara:strand:- start:722 stop:928 length:207 start_codon:yes stop_codon:yes gene_type:complete